MSSVDIPSIQMVLRDQISRTTQQLANGIEDLLSDIPKTDGSSLVHYAPSEKLSTSSQVFGTLG